jgi:glycosyltransferase involved in cell wall biosynthesis
MTNKPHVLYLINSFSSGGAERGILSLIETGFFKDVDLTLVAIHKGTGNLYDELAEKLGEDNIHYCSASDNLSATAMLKTWWYIFRTLLTHKYSHLMLSLTQSNLIGCTAAMLFPRLHVISFLHSTKVSKRIYILFLKLTTWRVRSYLYDTQQTHNAASDIYSNRAITWLYAPLVWTSSKNVKKDYTLRLPIRIFSAGRLSQVKNYAEAITAMSLLKGKGLDLHYYIAGDGEDKANLQALIENLKLENNITLLGHTKNWIEQAINHDVFLLASTHEGLSIVTVEAMGAGMPVVATNVGGIIEYGKHQHNMLKSESSSAEDIAHALELVISDEALRHKLGSQAAKDAHENFSLSEVQTHITKASQALFN